MSKPREKCCELCGKHFWGTLKAKRCYSCNSKKHPKKCVECNLYFKGGTSELSNLVTACEECNLIKNSREISSDIIKRIRNKIWN